MLSRECHKNREMLSALQTLSRDPDIFPRQTDKTTDKKKTSLYRKKEGARPQKKPRTRRAPRKARRSYSSSSSGSSQSSSRSSSDSDTNSDSSSKKSSKRKRVST
nr:ORF3 [Torque teno virus]